MQTQQSFSTTNGGLVAHDAYSQPFWTLPRMFTREQIRSILANGFTSTHHDTDHGSDGHQYAPVEKPLQFPWVAEVLWKYISAIQLGTMSPHSVDAAMKLYRLRCGGGVVAPHRDVDFDGPDGTIARYSILVYLSDAYSGGATVFNRTTRVPHTAAGEGIIFKHDLLHEGLAVRSGVKYVLKTDLFVK